MKWWQILLLAGMVLLRFAYLDQDAPVYQLTNVCQEDEPYYCQGAIHKLCSDEGRVVQGFGNTNGEAIDMYSRLFMYSSLKVFGNNYWGLRVPDVIISLLTILLMFSMFRKIDKENKYAFLITLLLFTNFYLFTFSRYHNPQIFSAFGVALTVWILVRYGYEKPLPLIAAGFVGAASVLFIYPMNFFVLAGSGLFVLIKSVSKKKFLPLIYFAAGVILGPLVFAIGLHSIGSSINEYLELITRYNASYDVVTTEAKKASLLHAIRDGIAALVNTGFFRFQLWLLMVMAISVPYLVSRARNKNNTNSDASLLVLLIIGCQFLQDFFALSYPFKKLLVDIPVIALAVFIVIKDFKDVEIKGRLKWILMTCLVVGIYCCFFNFRSNKSAFYWGFFGNGCYANTPAWFDYLNIISAVLLIVTAVCVLFFSGKWGTIALETGLVISILANSAFIYKTFIIDRKYQVRDCLVSLAPELHNKVVAGGFPFTFQLYTNSVPILHGYHIESLKGPRGEIMDSMLVNKKLDFTMEKVMPHEPETTYYKNNPNLKLEKVFNFDCYSYYLYKNTNK